MLATPNLAPQLAELAVVSINNAQHYSEAARKTQTKKWTSAAFELHILNREGYVFYVPNQHLGSDFEGMIITTEDDWLLWIDWILVRPSARRRGVARALLRAAVGQAQALGRHKIWCESLTTNLHSLALLQAEGFVRIAELPNHWYKQDFCLLIKDLE